jgi:uncharacterized repeat protein (TIGR03803 family)
MFGKSILLWVTRFVRVSSMASIAFAIVPVASAQATTAHNEQVLYSFQGLPNDGYQPVGAVVFDAAGNLYGATAEGGSSSCPSIQQCGTVYELSPPAVKGEPWTETVLYVFKGNKFNDGTSPYGGLVIDSAGNLYGTTGYGGTGNCVLLGILVGCGTVYELSPPAQKGGTWTEQVLYSFPTPEEGYAPVGDLVFDSSGNLYGATAFGGGYGTTCDEFYQYCGAIFELSPPQQKGGSWSEQTLYGFKGTARGVLTGDGGSPNGGLRLDASGNIYGTTMDGGFAVGVCGGTWQGGPGCGTVFELVRPRDKGGAWTENVLHIFLDNSEDGATPYSGITFDAELSSIYGTTGGGGPTQYGTVYRLSPPSGNSLSWTETLLFSFQQNNSEGAIPTGSLVLGPGSTLYGTTSWGGGDQPDGTVFELSASAGGKSEIFNLDVLHTFEGPPDGQWPSASLVRRAGSLYSTTPDGGTGVCGYTGCGTIFEVEP